MLKKKEREIIIKVIKEILQKDPRVIFSYLFGSFLDGENFNDIDVGVYVKEEVNPFVLQAELKTKISEELGKEGYKKEADFFDVRVLNEAPFYILGEIMSEGLLLVDKDFDLRSRIAEEISFKYRECAGMLREAFG